VNVCFGEPGQTVEMFAENYKHLIVAEKLHISTQANIDGLH